MKDLNFLEIPLNEIKPFVIANVNLQLKKEMTSRMTILGTPGCGKSDIIREICKEQGWALSVKYISNMSIEQITGIPCKVESDDFAVFSKPEIFNFSNFDFIPENFKENETPAILLIDDFHLADKTFQKYLFQLLTYKSINNYKLPKNVAIILAGNRISDKALAHTIPAPIMNRLSVYEVKASADDWILNFAISNNIRSEIISFISKFPHLLSSIPIESSPWASPRSWTFLSEQIDEFEERNTLDVTNLNLIASSLLGQEVASEFISFCELYSKWNIDKLILMETDKLQKLFLTEINNNPINAYAITYATMNWLIEKSKKFNFDIKAFPEIKKYTSNAYNIMTSLLSLEFEKQNNISVQIKPLVIAGTNFMYVYGESLQKSSDIKLFNNFSDVRFEYLLNLQRQTEIDWIYYDILSTVFNIKLSEDDKNKIDLAYSVLKR